MHAPGGLRGSRTVVMSFSGFTGLTYSDNVVFKYFSCFLIIADFLITFLFQVALEEFFQKIRTGPPPSHQNFVCLRGWKKHCRGTQQSEREPRLTRCLSRCLRFAAVQQGLGCARPRGYSYDGHVLSFCWVSAWPLRVRQTHWRFVGRGSRPREAMLNQQQQVSVHAEAGHGTGPSPFAST